MKRLGNFIGIVLGIRFGSFFGPHHQPGGHKTLHYGPFVFYIEKSVRVELVKAKKNNVQEVSRRISGGYTF